MTSSKLVFTNLIRRINLNIFSEKIGNNSLEIFNLITLNTFVRTYLIKFCECTLRGPIHFTSFSLQLTNGLNKLGFLSLASHSSLPQCNILLGLSLS